MKRISLLIVIVILMSISLGYFYNQLSLINKEYKLFNLSKTVTLYNGKGEECFDLVQDTYLLKIKCVINNEQWYNIFFDGNKVLSNYLRNGKQNFFYKYLPRSSLKSGKHCVRFDFGQGVKEATLTLTSYRKLMDNGYLILFKNSTKENLGTSLIKSSAIFLFIISFLTVLLMILWPKYSELNFTLLKYHLLVFSPYLLFLSGVEIFNCLNKIFLITIKPSSFLIFFVLSFLGSFIIAVFFDFLSNYSSLEIKEKNIWDALSSFFKKILSSIKLAYRRSFSDKFIIVALFIMLICPIVSVLVSDGVAQQLAILIYYLLTLGILGKLFNIFLGGKSDK